MFLETPRVGEEVEELLNLTNVYSLEKCYDTLVHSAESRAKFLAVI